MTSCDWNTRRHGICFMTDAAADQLTIRTKVRHAKLMASWQDVHRLVLAFPDTREGTSSRGQRAWTVNEKGFAWERPLRPKDLQALGAAAPTGPVLAVRTPDLEMKEALLLSDPAVYFTTPHFDGYPAILIRLEIIKLRQLKALLSEAWLARAPKRSQERFLKRSVNVSRSSRR